MRKQTKLAAVLTASALFALGASMSAFASGWEMEDGSWVYLDNDGDRVTEDWKKSGSNYYWLDEDGYMATDTLVEDDDDYYYVDANGVRVTNRWVSVPNEDDDEVDGKEVDVLWYYMGSSGKAYTATSGDFKTATIGGKKYFFDEEGRMVSGWTEYEDNIYYLGDENEGWAYTGWQYLEIDEDIEDDADLNGDEYNDEEWFYFQSSGKARKNTRKYIDGAYYAFDANGVMTDQWIFANDGTYAAATSSNAANRVASENRAYYKEDSGYQKTGWAYLYEENDAEGDENWYYLESSNKGTPFNYNGEKAVGSAAIQEYEYGNEEADSYDEDTVAAKTIKGETYLFDNTGAMLTGVYEFYGDVNRTGSSALKAGIYYFNDGDGSVKGQMETGKTTVTFDGDDYVYYFKSNGPAYRNEMKDSSVYNNYGVRVEAEDGNSYEVVTIGDDSYDLDEVTIGKKTYVGGTIVVSSSGKVKKSGSVTVDGIKYIIGGDNEEYGGEVPDYFVSEAYDKDLDSDEREDLTDLYQIPVLKETEEPEE